VKRIRRFSDTGPRARNRPGRIIFVTGTDTGVGKTVFTSLLLHHLRTTGCHALAMKPFCSGGRADVRLLRAMQDEELTEDEINPFYFPEPVAPLVSARQRHRAISLDEVVRQIQKIAARCECLLIEGSGGLFVPLGENPRRDSAVTSPSPPRSGGEGRGEVVLRAHGKTLSQMIHGKEYLVSDLIQRLDCEVIVVARNRLGTINHTLLTVNALQNLGVNNLTVVLMGGSKKDASTKSNAGILSELLKPIQVRELGFLSKNASKSRVLKNCYKKVKKTLAPWYH
jgi:dethiobiotin synthetase